MSSQDRERDDANPEDGESESIFKVDTVPPPAGEDAYNAPTRVGPVSPDAWNKLMAEADAVGKKAADAEASAPRSVPRPTSGRASYPSRPDGGPSIPPPPLAPAVDAADFVPRTFDDDDDHSHEGATVLHGPSQDQIRIRSAEPSNAPPPLSEPPPGTPSSAPSRSRAPQQRIPWTPDAAPAPAVSKQLALVAICAAVLLLIVVMLAFGR